MKSNILLTLLSIFFFLSGSIAQNEINKNLRNPIETFPISFDHNATLNYVKQHAKGESKFELTIPNPQGSVKVMALRNQVMSPEFALANQDLYTLDIFNSESGKFIGCVTISPYGFYFLDLSSLKPSTLNSIHHTEPSKLVYSDAEQIVKKRSFMPSCAQNGKIDERKNFSLTEGMRFANDFQWGDKINRYRAAVVCTGEFYQANGNADGPVNTVITNSINSISAIFRNDLSVILQLNGVRLYSDPNTDPFIPDQAPMGQPRTTQASQAVNAVFTSSTYDVGHVFHTHKSGDDWGSGGVAYLQSVCDNKAITSQSVPIIKAGGWSGSFSNDDYSWYQLAAHEYAHMFGAEHTFNGLGNSCTDAIGENSAVEIGSGTTIMSYSGLCNTDQNISNGEADGYFHTFSIQQISSYILGEGGTCANNSNSGNAIPVADANPCGSNLEIPKGTPFYLNGSATDSDPNATLTYTWEQMDEDGNDITPSQGVIGAAASFLTKAPLFRCYSPTTNTERYFPALNNSNPSFEVLPQVARNINMAFTVRDNKTAGGAVGTDFITLKVNSTGPFTVTKPSSGEVISAGAMTTFTWNTNGSQALCTNLRIKLSIDGGKTYPTVIAENVAYAAGTLTFTMPANAFKSTTAKIMMECMDRECAKFYALSSNTFTIQSTCDSYGSVVCPETKVTADQGASSLNISTTKYVGNNAIGARRTVSDSSPMGNVAINAMSGTGCAVVRNNYFLERFNIYVTKTGVYTFTVAPYISGVQRAFFSIFRSNYSPTNACATFVASSAIDAGGGSLFPSETFTASLTACTEYVIVMHSYQLPVNASIANIVGPGLVIEKITLPTTFTNQFAIVNLSNNTIAGISQNTDLTAYPGGNYRIYSINVQNLTQDEINALIGTSFTTFTQSKCLTPSANFRDVEIKSLCTISDIAISAQGTCDPVTNTHTQDLIITFDKAPTTGKLRVNGQDFDITTSPQTIKLTNIESDGLAKNVTALFSDFTSCTFTKNNVFTSPVSCCPAIVELGADISECVGKTVTLNGGNTGASYKWFKDGNEIMGQVSSTLSVTSSGLYRVEVTHSTGCKKSDVVTVTFNALPTVVLQSQLSFCETTTLTLQPTISGALSQQWLRDNTPITGSTAATLDVTMPGVYTVVVTSANGCTASATATTTIVPKPIVELGPPISKCESEGVTLNAGTGAQSYAWYRDGVIISGATTATYKPIQSGIYRVVVTSGANCSAEDQVNVMFFASPTILGLESEYKSCDNPITLQTMISGQQTILWYFNNSPIGSTNVESLPVTTSGTYIVEAINNIGCKSRDTAIVAFKQKPVIAFGSDIVACDGNSVELNGGTDGTIYRWSKDGQNLSNTTAKIMVTQGGTYAVTVTNAEGCTSTAQKMISFIPGPTLDLGGDKVICQDENYTITAVTNAINPTVRWLKNGILIPGETSLTLTINGEGNYEARLVGGTPPCEVSKNVTISINPKPGINIGIDKAICAGEPFPILDAGPNHTTINWTYNGTPIGTTRTITADKAGLYRALVTNSFNCQNFDDYKLTINPLPSLIISDSFDLCLGVTLNITAASDATSFQWKKGSSVIAGQTAETIKISEPGNFTVTAITAANCKTEANFTVTSRPSPSVNLGPDQVLCPDKTITLNAGNHASYAWSPDISSSATLLLTAGQPNATSTKSIRVVVKNQFGCSDVDTVIVKTKQFIKTTVTSDNTNVCNGVPVRLTSNGGGENWQWRGPAGTLSNLDSVSTTVSPIVTSIYSVVVRDKECPENIDSAKVEIKVIEGNNISAGEDGTVIKGLTIKLGATPSQVAYQWNNTNFIEGPSNIFNPVVRIDESTTFTVTITDVNGCEFVDSVFIKVIDDPLSLFKAVTFISPNDDGANDVLEFQGLEAFPENTLKVYNRWGNIVFEKVGYQSDGDEERFDGTRNGDRLPADTYYYVLEFADRLVKSALTIMWPE